VAPYGMNFKGVMVSLGKVAFLDLWDKLAAARNEIAHGKYVMGGKITQNELVQIQQECLSVFAVLQNHASTGKPYVPTA